MADTKISDLTTASALDGTELLLLSQGAADRKVDLDTFREDLDWVRPSDWPAMPSTAANTIHILAAVFDHGTNRVAIRMSTSSGTWSVDWGDGTSTTGVASNANAERTYDFADGDLPAATSRGYKVAVITITADSGNFTVFNPSISHSGGNTGTPPWLEMQVNGSSLTTLTLATTNVPKMLEHINFVAVGSVTAMSFSGMDRLRTLKLPSNFFSNMSGTGLFNCFSSCHSLVRIDLSSIPASGLTNTSQMFQECSSLKEVNLPAGMFPAGNTNTSSMFRNCRTLQRVSIPSGALAGVTNSSNMFTDCYSLREVTFPSGALAAVTNPSAMFANCRSLQSVAIPSGAFASATAIDTMFTGCASLQRIDFPTGMLGSLSTLTNVFATCGSLAKIVNCIIKLTFTLAACRLGAAELDEVYTALPTVTSQTITVTGNPGTTGDDPTIATAKGWTVTG